MDIFVIIISIILLGLFVFLYIRKSKDYKKIYERFKDVVDIERETEKAKNEHENLVAKFKAEENQLGEKERELKQAYSQKREVYEMLLQEISILEEDLDFISYGIYKPHFDFDTSEKYKEKIHEVTGKQRELVRNKRAALCSIEWTVSGSKAEGRKMTNRNIRLMLRAFNNECDAAMLKVRWNNVEQMEERINKAFEAINKLGEPNQTYITSEYLNLKLQELYLTHERQEKLNAEKEEQRRIRELMREEQKVQKEIEQAQMEAERDEQRYQKALERARSELAKVHGSDLEKLNLQIQELENNLHEAQMQKERAISRAQLTKSGHVYVISNLGSFGKQVFKIGMTRRLDPMDRVKELGDASVPFPFDIHAIIYSKDAPELESRLHQAFVEKRLNLVNQRKEFFEVSLDEIERIVSENHGDIEFTKFAEAREFRETIAIRAKEDEIEKRKQEIKERFPESL